MLNDPNTDPLTNEALDAAERAYAQAPNDQRLALAAAYRAIVAVDSRPPPMAWTVDQATGIATPHYPERERIADLEETLATRDARILELETRPLCPTRYDIGWDEHRPVTQLDVDAMQKALHEMCDQLSAKDARIAELDTELATMRTAFTAANVQPEPPPAHNPFRTFPSDPRRIGG